MKRYWLFGYNFESYGPENDFIQDFDTELEALEYITGNNETFSTYEILNLQSGQWTNKNFIANYLALNDEE